jgi:L-ascorbate metabolism protein UlaG (beta-lactamase superfamily)
MTPPRKRHILRKILISSVVLVVLLLVLGTGTAYMLSVPGYSGSQSDHFDGERFVNEEPLKSQGFGAFLKFMFGSQRQPWREWTDNNSYPAPPERVGTGELRVTFINHSTTLIQMDGLNIVTDPIWSERCSPFSWIGPKRHRAPGIDFDSLPPIDFVLISHNHYDHLDLPTVKKLSDKYKMPIITGLGNKTFLQQNDITNVTEIDWWDKVPLANSITLTGVPARHFSGRGLSDRQTTLWMGFVIQSPAGNVYFAGDTGFGQHFEEIRRRFAPIRLALLPIGAYLPRWFMSGVHVSPDEAVRAHQILGAGTSIVIHFGTFRLGVDGQDQPVDDLNAALDAVKGPRPQFWALDFGEGRDIPLLPD